MKLLITGGAGFIGSAFVRLALARWPEAELVVLDKLTYAGNLANLDEVQATPRFSFVHGDICSPRDVERAMQGATHVVNFAAETHVDRSILDPGAFLRTDIEGTRVLLEAARRHGIERFVQVSTDEVYGDVPAPQFSHESDALRPRSPYSASKAGADLMTNAYHATYGVPTLITRGANTYGPRQYPEKLVPLFVTNAFEGLPLPVYGDGMQIRDWLAVEDHCSGIAAVLERGAVGEIYNLGAGNERTNRDVVQRIVELTGCDPNLVRHVQDRAGHDRRYALDSTKAHALGWKPTVSFEEGLARTVDWYRTHERWWRPLKDADFQRYWNDQYAERLAASTA